MPSLSTCSVSLYKACSSAASLLSELIVFGLNRIGVRFPSIPFNMMHNLTRSKEFYTPTIDLVGWYLALSISHIICINGKSVQWQDKGNFEHARCRPKAHAIKTAVRSLCSCVSTYFFARNGSASCTIQCVSSSLKQGNTWHRHAERTSIEKPNVMYAKLISS